MELLTQNVEIYLSAYIIIVFFVPWLVLMYWIIRFHIAVKEVMGSAYTAWEAAKQSPRYATENKDFGEIFSKRNWCLAIVLLVWIVGSAVLFSLIYLVGMHDLQATGP